MNMTKTEQRLRRRMGLCITEHGLIEEGDHVMVAISGGKDSYALVDLLIKSQSKTPVSFAMTAVHVDQGQPGYDGAPLRDWLTERRIGHHIIDRDTYSVVMQKSDGKKTHCALCSRLRRGILYGAAQELGCNKIALGHHADDAVETLMLNLMFNGTLSAMPAKLTSQYQVQVIRPLLYCDEDSLRDYAREQCFPILPCNLCGSQPNLQRQQVKRLLTQLEQQNPQLRHNMLAALGNVKPDRLLDRTLHMPKTREEHRNHPAVPSKGGTALPLLPQPRW